MLATQVSLAASAAALLLFYICSSWDLPILGIIFLFFAGQSYAQLQRQTDAPQALATAAPT